MAIEREIKLDVADDFDMPDVATLGEGIDAASATTSTYETTWYDTADLRLARWGASLRVREGEGWTVKLDPSAEGDVLSRAEVTLEGNGDVPEAAANLVRAFARGAQLVPVIRTTTSRRRTELRSGADAVVDLVDDSVEVTEGPTGASRFRQLEIELRSETAAELAGEIAKAMRAAGAATEPGRSKVERVLGGRPPAEFDVPVVGPRSTIFDLLRAAIAGPVRALVTHDIGVRLGRDPEDVHKARVATRRLRSNLRTFAAWFDPGWATELRAELRWLARDLGAVRDADVMLERLRAEVEGLDEGDRRAARPLLDRLASARGAAGAVLLASLATERYDRALERLVSGAREPCVRGDVDAPVHSLGVVVERPWRMLLGAVERAEASPDPGTLHQVRIRAKRVRYAAEAIEPAFGGPARRFARSATELQDVLGAYHDSVVLEAWLREAARSARATRAFVAGELAVFERRAGEVALARWPGAWRSFSRKRNLFWT